MSPTVREATAVDLPAVLGVLDAAALETDHERVREATDRGEVLVAVAESGGPVVGALVLVECEVVNVAVRPRRRDQGVGSALVAAAAARCDRLVAEFDGGVRPFYESLGFAVEPLADDRYRGTLG